jgi:hypothetical protein
MGSPPLIHSKNDVLIFLSVKSIVIVAAKTGKTNTRRIAVNNTDQQNKGKRCIGKPSPLIFNIVTIKFIAPKRDDKPAKCKL